MRACRVADEAHAPRGRDRQARRHSRSTVPSRDADSALMVKSRRSASACQSRPNATLAWRPKVSTSWRSVVTSNGRPSMITVTVPCSMPVGTALKPAAVHAPHHLVRHRRGGDVDLGDRDRRAGRCAPRRRPRALPRRRGRAPRAAAAARRRCSQAASSLRGAARSPRPAPARTCRPRDAPARRSSPAARR